MTSKISFTKLLREDMKRRSWLLALSVVVFFLLGPVNCLMNLENQFRMVQTNMGYYTLKDLKEWYLGFVGFNNGLLMAAICIFAVLCGITGYQYLHSRTKIDLLHSIPVKREKLFMVQYVSGLLFFLVPYILCMLICLLIGGFQGVVTARHILCSVGGVGLGTLYFLMIYHVAILAMMLTGKILVGVLGTAVLCGIGPAVSMLQSRMCSTFFETYFTTVSDTDTAFRSALSPVGAYVYVSGRLSGDGKFPGVFLLAAVLLTVVLLVLDLWLYHRRPSEAAENAMAFGRTESIIKVCMIVPASLWVGVFLGSFNSSDTSVAIGWFIFGIVISLLILHTVVEFIYHMDFRGILGRKWSLLVAAVLAFACTAVFYFDLTGYDSYLPGEDKIESMAVYTSNFNGRFNYPYNYGTNRSAGSEQRTLDHVNVKEFQPIYKLAEEGVKNKDLRKEVYSQAAYMVSEQRKIGESSDDTQYDDVYIRYHLKSGRNVYRRYLVKYENSEETIASLCESKAFKEQLLPLNYIKNENVTQCTVTDRFQRQTILNMTEEQKNNLMDTFREEQNSASYATLTDGPAAGVLSIEETEDRSSSMYEYSICPGYPKTIALLKELGCDLEEEWKAEYVEDLQVTNYYDSGAGTPPSQSFTDPKEVEEILKALTWGGEYGPVKETIDYAAQVDITWNINGVKAYGNYYFTEGKIPECVIRAFE